MRILMVSLAIVMVSCIVAEAQLVFQIKLEKDSDTWKALEATMVTYEEVDGVKVVYDTLPDPDSIGMTDLQEWFVSAEEGNGYNAISFLASVAGIPLPQGNKKYSQYWLRYGDGIIFSSAADFTIMQPRKPSPK